jgi:DNA-binding response OmpR family regulator
MTHLSGRILVVDDNPSSRIELVRNLEQHGHAVTPAGSDQLAIQVLQEQQVDLVILDIAIADQLLAHIEDDSRLRHTPIVIVLALEEMKKAIQYIEQGAADYLPKPVNPVMLKARVDAGLEKQQLRDQKATYLLQIAKEKKRANDLLNVVIPLGIALSAERHFDRMLEQIVLEAMSFCNADGGTLYLRTEEKQLEFVIMRNRSLNIAIGGSSTAPATVPPLQLYDGSGEPNHRNVATYTAHCGASVNIPDAYHAEGFDFSGPKEFDARTGYRSTSFLTIPLKGSRSGVIGVLQLINAQDPQTGQVVAFDDELQHMVETLSSLASVALEGYIREESLREEIQQLRIELDETKRAKQVAEITQTDYFQQLRSKVKGLKARSDQ